MQRSVAELITTPEGKTFECKRDLSSTQNLLKTLVAFANSAGGLVLIGVADGTRDVIGLPEPLQAEEQLCNLIADGISPRLVPNVELVAHGDLNLLLVEVFPSSQRPHHLNKQGPEQGVFVRLGSTNRQADPALIEELHRSVSGAAFDEQPIAELSVDDLDREAITAAFEGIRSISDQDLYSLRVLTTVQGRDVPTAGGVLLFGQNRDRWFPDAWLQCARFVGTTKAGIFDQLDIHAPLPQALEQALAFLKKHAMRSADFQELRRVDRWSIPLASLREALTNALVHADYSQRGAPIRVAFFDDRIEIESPGVLIPGLSIEDLPRGISRLRNRVISRVFRELGLIEQWGSGVPVILEEAASSHLPPPLFEEVGLRFRVTLPLASQPPAEQGQSRLGGAESRAESGAESLAEGGLAALVLKALAQGPMSKSEIAQALGRDSVSGALNRTIRQLLDRDEISYTLPEIPNSRLQKYRLLQEAQ
ncbi:putative DNA binding domain-containing protein [Cyanobium sp. Aljojuca 7D2]|uniref:AlbA family DNA-binding domain-containing protein n=1 Tax=Cyanobium sp. Aljojuca 7D2 TaxID=2823698 RepID=UPI0020CD1B4B|nr:helix-turn-helix domain-containing protein [Cyanobium sp. Aljojuca 7D2]MCP9891412.1 putative DNA binding domain-containing protein [Cyanobium sp. Aljojuca 7D2]